MKKIVVLITAIMCLIACEKPISEDSTSSDVGTVTINFSPYQQTTRASSPDELFTKMNLMFYQAGTVNRAFDKIKTQTIEEAEFGTISLTVPVGNYDVLCVGHSSVRNATLNKDKVAFTAYQNRKITDTFWNLSQLDVNENENTYSLILNRATAMFRMIITDETPDIVTQFKFDYSGGSADFNPNNGEGVTNSKQSELREVNDDSTYEIYTFPKGTNKLKITAYALDGNGTIISQRIFEEVPIKARCITSYEGKFFDGSTGTIGGSSLSIEVNGEWEETNSYTF